MLEAGVEVQGGLSSLASAPSQSLKVGKMKDLIIKVFYFIFQQSQLTNATAWGFNDYPIKGGR